MRIRKKIGIIGVICLLLCNNLTIYAYDNGGYEKGSNEKGWLLHNYKEDDTIGINFCIYMQNDNSQSIQTTDMCISFYSYNYDSKVYCKFRPSDIATGETLSDGEILRGITCIKPGVYSFSASGELNVGKSPASICTFDLKGNFVTAFELMDYMLFDESNEVIGVKEIREDYEYATVSEPGHTVYLLYGDRVWCKSHAEEFKEWILSKDYRFDEKVIPVNPFEDDLKREDGLFPLKENGYVEIIKEEIEEPEEIIIPEVSEEVVTPQKKNSGLLYVLSGFAVLGAAYFVYRKIYK